jgi:hypothetical protein
MDIHLLTEVGTYLETGGLNEDVQIISRSTQADSRSLIRIEVWDPTTRSISFGTPIKDGDLVVLRSRFNEFFDVPVSGSQLRSNASLGTPSPPESVFRIVSLDGQPDGEVIHGDRVGIRGIIINPIPPSPTGVPTPAFGISAVADTTLWMTVDRDSPDHPISFRDVGVLDELSATEGFRFLTPTDLQSFTLVNNTATVHYDEDNIAIADLSVGDTGGLPGGSLFDIEIDGDTEFAASNNFRVTLPEGTSSMRVEITLKGHFGSLDQCETKRLDVLARAVVLGTSRSAEPLRLEAGHIPYMRMKEDYTFWGSQDQRGCLELLLPGVFRPIDLFVVASLSLLSHPNLNEADLPLENVSISSEDPVILLLHQATAVLTLERPITFVFAVRDPRRQPEHCGSIRVNWGRPDGVRSVAGEARFPVFFRLGAISLDPLHIE